MKKIVINITYTFFVLLVLGLVFLLMAPSLPGLGNFEVKIVKSGSMEPNIMTGAVVAIFEAESYKTGDVITFSEKGAKIPTTHRIIGIEKVNGKNHFITKGDANEDRDANLVAPNDVVGKVVLDIPYVGFVLDFARQPIGFGLLVGIPALMIVLDELINIWLEVRRIRGIKFNKDTIAPLVVAPYNPNQTDGEGESTNDLYKNHLSTTVPVTKRMDIRPIERKIGITTQARQTTGNYHFSHDIRPKMGTVMAGFVLVVFLWGQMSEGIITLAYPSDTEASLNNNFQATALDFSIFADKTNFLIDNDEIISGSDALISLTLHDLVNEDLVYDVEVKENGASALCDILMLEAEAPFSYNNNLKNLSKTGLSLDEDFSLNFSLSNPYDGFESCSLDLTFTAHLAENPEESAYFDVETITFKFSPVSPIVPGLNSVTTSSEIGLTNDSLIVPTINDASDEEIQVEKELVESELASEEIVEPKEFESSEEESGDETEKEILDGGVEKQELESEKTEQDNIEIEQVANVVIESKEVETEKEVEKNVSPEEEQQNEKIDEEF